LSKIDKAFNNTITQPQASNPLPKHQPSGSNFLSGMRGFEKLPIHRATEKVEPNSNLISSQADRAPLDIPARAAGAGEGAAAQESHRQSSR